MDCPIFKSRIWLSPFETNQSLLGRFKPALWTEEFAYTWTSLFPTFFITPLRVLVNPLLKKYSSSQSSISISNNGAITICTVVELKAAPVTASVARKVTFLISPFARFSNPPKEGTSTVIELPSISSISKVYELDPGVTSQFPSTETLTSTSSLRFPLFVTV